MPACQFTTGQQTEEIKSLERIRVPLTITACGASFRMVSTHSDEFAERTRVITVFWNRIDTHLKCSDETLPAPASGPPQSWRQQRLKKHLPNNCSGSEGANSCPQEHPPGHVLLEQDSHDRAMALQGMIDRARGEPIRREHDDGQALHPVSDNQRSASSPMFRLIIRCCWRSVA